MWGKVQSMNTEHWKCGEVVCSSTKYMTMSKRMTLKAGVLHLYLYGTYADDGCEGENVCCRLSYYASYFTHTVAHSMACLVSFETSVVLNNVVH